MWVDWETNIFVSNTVFLISQWRWNETNTFTSTELSTLKCLVWYYIKYIAWKQKKIQAFEMYIKNTYLAPAWGFCYSIFSFMCMFCRSWFAHFLLHINIVLSVLLQFTDSDYPFGIFKFFLLNTPLTNQRSIFVLVILPIHITKFIFEHCHTQGCRTWTGNFSAAGNIPTI